MDPLTDVAALARALAGPDRPTLLDVRWSLSGPPGAESYQAGHLPGAVFVDLDRDLSGPPGPGGRHPLPAAGDFQAAMRRAGVRARGTVVVYDEAGSQSAARAWWLLRYFGHPAVQVLDGGYRAWAGSGRPVVTGGQPGGGAGLAAGDFTARPGQMPVLDAEAAGALARDGVLLDARGPERYRGESEPLDPAAGHIPGAISAPSAGNVGEDGRFLPPGALRERFAALGATAPGSGGAREVGCYCGSGVTAANDVLALEIAGVPAALYVGSWSHWSADPSRPVATGPLPG